MLLQIMECFGVKARNHSEQNTLLLQCSTPILHPTKIQVLNEVLFQYYACNRDKLSVPTNPMPRIADASLQSIEDENKLGPETKFLN